MYLQELRSRFSVSSRASLPSLYFFFDCCSGSRVEIFLPKRCPPIVSNWSVMLADFTSIFLIRIYEMFSRSSAMIRRFSRKAHKWLRTVTFIFLIGTYEMFSRGSSMIRRFSRKTHKWLRTVFFYLSHGSSFLRVFLVHLAFSTEFSQFSQFFCSLVELRTFSVKKF